ncbi:MULTISPECIES: PAS domain-containing protein [unclassified Iodidimonas]|jgi:PAS domain S-box-containing protein|uniref:PAS domain-containing protein n=1 Tax=unclassified Iodidimonas TaxID=2626145 RepID=UPI0024830C21|nr:MULTISPECIES: PAS domain-containing protein [unclassified Iodidimonas]
MSAGKERFLACEDIIVSKTDLKGYITYANRVFLDIADYCEDEVLGKPHNVIRDPDTPRVIFKALWDAIAKGDEIFTYVKNSTKNGDYYWVLAHVTPTFDKNGQITGYHSNRRAPDRPVIDEMTRLFAELCAIEQGAVDRKAGLIASEQALQAKIAAAGQTFDQFIFSTINTRVAA